MIKYLLDKIGTVCVVTLGIAVQIISPYFKWFILIIFFIFADLIFGLKRSKVQGIKIVKPVRKTMDKFILYYIIYILAAIIDHTLQTPEWNLPYVVYFQPIIIIGSFATESYSIINNILQIKGKKRLTIKVLTPLLGLFGSKLKDAANEAIKEHEDS